MSADACDTCGGSIDADLPTTCSECLRESRSVRATPELSVSPESRRLVEAFGKANFDHGKKIDSPIVDWREADRVCDAALAALLSHISGLEKERRPTQTVNGYDARFWSGSYRMLPDTIDGELKEFIQEDDVAEEAIYIGALENAAAEISRLRSELSEATRERNEMIRTLNYLGYGWENGRPVPNIFSGTPENTK